MEKLTKKEIEDVSIGRKEEIGELIHKLVLQSKRSIETDLKVITGDIIQLTTLVLELVEKVSKTISLTSQEKLYIATDVITKSLEYVPRLSEEDKRDIQILIPNTIETIIEASKGRFSFGTNNKKKNNIKIDTVKVSNQLYDRLVKFIKKENYNGEMVVKNVTIIVVQLMSLVEEYPALTGSEKKVIVMNVMQQLVDESNNLFPDITEEQKSALNLGLNLLSGLIDTIIYSAKGKIYLNEVVENVKGCFRSCFAKRK